MEVPEIYEKIVRIEASAREAGARSKIAVSSRDRDVDPVGACVGMKGSRVQAVVQELRGEKIDIVPYDPDPARFVCNAIAPAEVARVIIDAGSHTMELIVPDEKLSLAIGKKGQNVRLASQLTGWRIDIHSESKVREMEARARPVAGGDRKRPRRWRSRAGDRRGAVPGRVAFGGRGRRRQAGRAGVDYRDRRRAPRRRSSRRRRSAAELERARQAEEAARAPRKRPRWPRRPPRRRQPPRSAAGLASAPG